MFIKNLRLHRWNVSPEEAITIQKRLQKRIVLRKNLPRITRIAAADVGFAKHTSKVVAAVVVFSFPQLKLIERVIKAYQTDFPYIPGLLTFREGPVLLQAFSTVKHQPDLIIFDGQGIAHPRRMGLATHMGILLDIPTIGCAKSLLFGQITQPANFKGAYSYIYDINGETIGAAVRTRQRVRCIFVSCGYKISLENAIKIILMCTSNWRIPEPLRVAHRFSQI